MTIVNTLPSGTFSDPLPGKLTVAFTAWMRSRTSDWPNGSNDMQLLGNATMGALSRNVPLRMGQQTAGTVELDYPGGSTTVSASVTHVASSFTSPGAVLADVRIRFIFMKR